MRLVTMAMVLSACTVEVESPRASGSAETGAASEGGGGSSTAPALCAHDAECRPDDADACFVAAHCAPDDGRADARGCVVAWEANGRLCGGGSEGGGPLRYCRPTADGMRCV